MTEVASAIENGHSNDNSAGSSPQNMMIRSGPESIPEEDHNFPSPPYSHHHQGSGGGAPNLLEKGQEHLDDHLDTNDDPLGGMHVGDDEGGMILSNNAMEMDNPHGGTGEGDDNSMDSFVDDSSCGSHENYPPQHHPQRNAQQQLISRMSSQSSGTGGGHLKCPGSESEHEEGIDDGDSDIEGKLIIDANDHQQQQLQLQEGGQHHRIIESSKIRSSVLANTGGSSNRCGSRSGGSDINNSRPCSTSPRDGSPIHNNNNNSGSHNTILNMMMMKERASLVNGHGQHHHQSQHLHRSSLHHGSSPYQHPSSAHHSHHDGGERHSGGSNGGHHISGHPNRSSSGSSLRTHPRELMKHERKSHSRSPLQSEAKPENLAGPNIPTNFNTNIGNALLNLASLGSLASLQQSIPNLMSNSSNNSDISRSISNLLSQQQQQLQQQQQQQHQQQQVQQQQLSASALSALAAGAAAANLHHNSPLNLTNANGSGSNNNNYISSNNSNNINISSSNSPTAAAAALASSHLAQFLSHHQNNTNSNLLGSNANNPLINNNSSAGAGGGNGGGNMPQLILASGQIIQGIQGAQLLIPTSQGLMTQTILTIPLNQPGSPSPTLYPPSGSPQLPPHLQQHHSSNSSSHHHGDGRGASSHHHGGGHHGGGQQHGHGGRGHPISPPVAPIVPPAASPDFSDHPSALPAPNLNLGPHSVSQQMGAHIPMIHEKISSSDQHRNSSRNMNGRRESNTITTNGGLSISALMPQSKMSPCNSDHESDLLSDNDDSDQMVDGINLDEIKEFAKAFKLRRLSLGLTQTQVGQALSVTEGPAYSQSAICSALAWQLAQSQTHSNRTSIPQPSMFEKLDITPKSAQKIKPVLERWMKEAEDRFKNGHQNLNDFVGMEPSKKRKRRTSFTPQALEILNTHFERNTHPSGAEITTLAHQLGYEREVIRIWFCNKRQALKNTVRMMSKGSSPM